MGNSGDAICCILSAKCTFQTRSKSCRYVEERTGSLAIVEPATHTEHKEIPLNIGPRQASEAILEDGFILSPVERDNYDLAMKLVEEGLETEGFQEDGTPLLGGKFQVGEQYIAGRPVMIRFSLPSDYPAVPPSLIVEAQAARCVRVDE